MDSSIRKAIDSVIAETEAMSDSELQAEFDAAKDGAVGRAITEGSEFLSDQLGERPTSLDDPRIIKAIQDGATVFLHPDNYDSIVPDKVKPSRKLLKSSYLEKGSVIVADISRFETKRN